jgi:hypothetical protein
MPPEDVQPNIRARGLPEAFVTVVSIHWGSLFNGAERCWD